MHTRDDLEVLKTEFMQGPWETLEDFKRDTKSALPSKYNKYASKMVIWESEKKALTPIVLEKASLVLVDDKVKQLKKIKQRHIKLARLMQDKGREALEAVNAENINVDDARKILLTGLEQERTAIGLGEKGGTPTNLTQVNVNLPKTKFDEILNGQNFEELLEFIADIRREKARRAGTDSLIQEQTNP